MLKIGSKLYLQHGDREPDEYTIMDFKIDHPFSEWQPYIVLRDSSGKDVDYLLDIIMDLLRSNQITHVADSPILRAAGVVVFPKKKKVLS